MSNPTVNFLLCKKYFSVILALVLLFSPRVSQSIESRTIEKLIEGALSSIEKQNLIQEKQLVLKQGKENYFKYCVHCHGKKGKGDGKASKYINPQIKTGVNITTEKKITMSNSLGSLVYKH